MWLHNNSFCFFLLVLSSGHFDEHINGAPTELLVSRGPCTQKYQPWTSNSLLTLAISSVQPSITRDSHEHETKMHQQRTNHIRAYQAAINVMHPCRNGWVMVLSSQMHPCHFLSPKTSSCLPDHGFFRHRLLTCRFWNCFCSYTHNTV